MGIKLSFDFGVISGYYLDLYHLENAKSCVIY